MRCRRPSGCSARYGTPSRCARAADKPTPPAADVLGVLSELERSGVRYVLIGERAEVLHGSPLVPLAATVTTVARAGQRERLSAAIAAAGDRYASQVRARGARDRARRRAGPAGTRGYDDLRRGAVAIALSDPLEVTVASLVDLVRIAEASDDRARVPALRRTLELAAAAPAARAA